MSDMSSSSSQAKSALPPDDPQQVLTVANPDAPEIRHVSVAGNTYSILVSGTQTAGRYCLIDMHVPPGGGPPPHRHDFEEMFTLLEGELEFTFRGEKSVVRAGRTVNIPANAPHAFKNASVADARMLCMCTPAGQEEFFMAIGDAVNSRTVLPPKLSKDEIGERRKKAAGLLAKYRTEMVEPAS
jgi:quercetin dioxygenase-like cupin family protein